MTVLVRPAAASNMAAMNDIYNHYILNSPATFDIEPYTLERRLAWFAGYAGDGPHRVLAAVEDETVVGVAWSSQFRPKRAYDTTVETSVYCAPGAGGRGTGTLLYTALFEALQGLGLHRAVAAITQPNDASVALHRRFGFERTGTLSEVGFKFGRYWDVAWFEKRL